jgi:hypothetical protein
MSKLSFDLYLDESGNFEEDAFNKKHAPSLVGGLLMPSSLASNDYFERLIPDNTHAMVAYDKERFFSILDQLLADGGRFVIFSNEERLNIVNGDTTYLNILAEGIVKLLRNLRVQYEEFELHVLVATRQAVSYKQDMGYGEKENVRIEQEQYFQRLDEKIILAMGHDHIPGAELSLQFASATREKKLMTADIICNTYLTRKARQKFTEEDRQRIALLFENQIIYPVFENGGVTYIKRLFIEERYGEVLYHLSSAPNLTGLADLRRQLFFILAKTDDKVQDSYFSYVSLQIGQYNNSRDFSDGIHFAEGYKKNVLVPLQAFLVEQTELQGAENLSKRIRYWTFDTDFFILTMADHMGNTTKCAEYLQRCRENIEAIDHSWEHIDYYFTFCIRELMCLMGQFDFKAVLDKSKKLVEIFTETKELFGLIGAYDGLDTKPKSELLGKINGIRLQAYTNLLHEHPDVWEDALAASDAALAEFTSPSDVSRQYQYRCLLMVEAGKPQEALACLLQSCNISVDTPNALKMFVNAAYQNAKHPNSFSLMHYANVLRALAEVNDSRVPEMANALVQHPLFAEDLKSGEKAGHPWNLIFWNMSKYYRIIDQYKKAETLYKQALKLTKEHPEKATMYSFALSMTADWAVYCKERNAKEAGKAEREYQDVRERFLKMDIPMKMKEWFEGDPNGMNIKDLQNTANKYLK